MNFVTKRVRHFPVPQHQLSSQASEARTVELTPNRGIGDSGAGSQGAVDFVEEVVLASSLIDSDAITTAASADAVTFSAGETKQNKWPASMHDCHTVNRTKSQSQAESESELQSHKESGNDTTSSSESESDTSCTSHDSDSGQSDREQSDCDADSENMNIHDSEHAVDSEEKIFHGDDRLLVDSSGNSNNTDTRNGFTKSDFALSNNKTGKHRCRQHKVLTIGDDTISSDNDDSDQASIDTFANDNNTRDRDNDNEADDSVSFSTFLTQLSQSRGRTKKARTDARMQRQAHQLNRHISWALNALSQSSAPQNSEYQSQTSELPRSQVASPSTATAIALSDNNTTLRTPSDKVSGYLERRTSAITPILFDVSHYSVNRPRGGSEDVAEIEAAAPQSPAPKSHEQLLYTRSPPQHRFRVVEVVDVRTRKTSANIRSATSDDTVEHKSDSIGSGGLGQKRTFADLNLAGTSANQTIHDIGGACTERTFRVRCERQTLTLPAATEVRYAWVSESRLKGKEHLITEFELKQHQQQKQQPLSRQVELQLQQHDVSKPVEKTGNDRRGDAVAATHAAAPDDTGIVATVVASSPVEAFQGKSDTSFRLPSLTRDEQMYMNQFLDFDNASDNHQNCRRDTLSVLPDGVLCGLYPATLAMFASPYRRFPLQQLDTASRSKSTTKSKSKRKHHKNNGFAKDTSSSFPLPLLGSPITVTDLTAMLPPAPSVAHLEQTWLPPQQRSAIHAFSNFFGSGSAASAKSSHSMYLKSLLSFALAPHPAQAPYYSDSVHVPLYTTVSVAHRVEKRTAALDQDAAFHAAFHSYHNSANVKNNAATAAGAVSAGARRRLNLSLATINLAIAAGADAAAAPTVTCQSDVGIESQVGSDVTSAATALALRGTGLVTGLSSDDAPASPALQSFMQASWLPLTLHTMEINNQSDKSGACFNTLAHYTDSNASVAARTSLLSPPTVLLSTTSEQGHDLASTLSYARGGGGSGPVLAPSPSAIAAGFARTLSLRFTGPLHSAYFAPAYTPLSTSTLTELNNTDIISEHQVTNTPYSEVLAVDSLSLPSLVRSPPLFTVTSQAPQLFDSSALLRRYFDWLPRPATATVTTNVAIATPPAGSMSRDGNNIVLLSTMAFAAETASDLTVATGAGFPSLSTMFANVVGGALSSVTTRSRPVTAATLGLSATTAARLDADAASLTLYPLTTTTGDEFVHPVLKGETICRGLPVILEPVELPPPSDLLWDEYDCEQRDREHELTQIARENQTDAKSTHVTDNVSSKANDKDSNIPVKTTNHSIATASEGSPVVGGQGMTLLALEVIPAARPNLCADPAKDPVLMVCLYIRRERPLPEAAPSTTQGNKEKATKESKVTKATSKSKSKAPPTSKVTHVADNRFDELTVIYLVHDAVASMVAGAGPVTADVLRSVLAAGGSGAAALSAAAEEATLRRLGFPLTPPPAHALLQASTRRGTGLGATTSAEHCNSSVSTTAFAKNNTRATEINALTRVVANEDALYHELRHFILTTDPDVLIGYELQRASWGYLCARFAVAVPEYPPFALVISRKLHSYTPTSGDLSGNNQGRASAATVAGWQRYQAQKGMDLSCDGRIILNMWRLLRIEIKMSSSTLSASARDVLGITVPTHEHHELARWINLALTGSSCPRNSSSSASHFISSASAAADSPASISGGAVAAARWLSQQCRVTLDIISKLEFIDRTAQMAKVYGMRFYDVLYRGSQIRVETMLTRVARPLQFLCVGMSQKQIADQPGMEAQALTLEPEPFSFYSSPVAVLDFRSLYPSIVIAYNMCYSTCLGRLSGADLAMFTSTSSNKSNTSTEDDASLPETPPQSFRVPLGGFELDRNWAEIRALHAQSALWISSTGALFVKPTVREGVLPRMLAEILETRFEVKAAMKAPHVSSKPSATPQQRERYRLYNALQSALKLVANVTYGYTSAGYSGRMPCQVRKTKHTSTIFT